MAEKRKDSKGRVLKTGESERKDGSYQYRFTKNGKRHTVYASTLKQLREGGRGTKGKHPTHSVCTRKHDSQRIAGMVYVNKKQSVSRQYRNIHD